MPKNSIIALALFASMLSACGVPSHGQSKSKSSGYEIINVGGDGSTTGTTTDADAANGGDTGTSHLPIYSYRVSGTGYVSSSVSVQAGQTLRIRFTPGQSSSNAPYTHLGVYFTVNGQSQPSEMLGNGSYGAALEHSRIIDFSQALQGCTGNPTCRQSVSITVSKPNYDYFCITTGQYCPWTRVQDGHAWNGRIEVQTDDTEILL